MEFTTMEEGRAYRAREATRRRLRWEAYQLCNALCGKLDWTHSPDREARIRRALGHARARLARREEEG